MQLWCLPEWQYEISVPAKKVLEFEIRNPSHGKLETKVI